MFQIQWLAYFARWGRKEKAESASNRPALNTAPVRGLTLNADPSYTGA